MKMFIFAVLAICMGSGCASIENPNGRYTATPFSWKISTVAAYNRCMKGATAPAKAGNPPMPWVEADRYCRNAATFGAPPNPGSPDQQPPQICGQNVRCPEGVPDGYPKFDGVPPVGIGYQIINGQLYGIQPWGMSSAMPYPASLGPHQYAGSAFTVGMTGDPVMNGYVQSAASVPPVVTQAQYNEDMRALTEAVDASSPGDSK